MQFSSLHSQHSLLSKLRITKYGGFSMYTSSSIFLPRKENFMSI